MRIAVFSDLHLAPEPTNRCSVDERGLVDLCDRLEETCDRIVVAGDLFDLDRPRRPGAWEEQLAAIERAHPSLFARLQMLDWIWGNHDYQLQTQQVPEEREYVAAGLKMIVVHGHQWDMLLKKVPGVPQTANFVAGWLERARMDRTARFFQQAPWVIEKIIGRVRSGDDFTDRGTRGAASLIASGWDLVVAGHSHMLRLVPTAGGLYVNTGSLCEGSLDHVVIDLTEARVEAYRDGEMRQSAHHSGGEWVVDGVN